MPRIRDDRQPVGRAEGPRKSAAQRCNRRHYLPGILVGKMFCAAHNPFARIKSIDATAARKVPGVHAVLTGFDIPEFAGGSHAARNYRSWHVKCPLCRPEGRGGGVRTRIAPKKP